MRRRLPKTVTRDEAKAILSEPNTQTTTGARDRAMLLLMYRAGLRVGEVVGLRKRDLAADGAKLQFTGKGDKERRVALDADTQAALSLWLQHRKEFVTNGGPLFVRIKGHAGEGQFAGAAGKALSTRAAQSMLKTYARRALGEERGSEVSCHQLRHTHATELVEEGKNLRTIQERLGHARVSQTEVYTHVSVEAQAEAIADRAPLEDAPEPDADAQELAAKITGMTPEQREALRALLG